MISLIFYAMALISLFLALLVGLFLPTEQMLLVSTLIAAGFAIGFYGLFKKNWTGFFVITVIIFLYGNYMIHTTFVYILDCFIMMVLSLVCCTYRDLSPRNCYLQSLVLEVFFLPLLLLNLFMYGSFQNSSFLLLDILFYIYSFSFALIGLEREKKTKTIWLPLEVIPVINCFVSLYLFVKSEKTSLLLPGQKDD